ncbi:MAG TPA: BTAD domain-containing putative transcriptional regulator, partial [Gemmatimonadales bacterium]|nr:BTAD domain-containing putative transcriptional regulator [Gemmatimonadales bacterium]
MLRLRLFGPLELSASDGRDLRPLLAQPKRVAVLACIAARPAGEFVRRDSLLGLFWPELDQAAARRSLRQALHLLRTHLGPDALVSRGDEDLAVNPDQLSVDVPDFLAAAGFRRGEALELYRGDFLAGFFLSGGSVEFERWLEETRSSLRDTAARLSSVLARESEGTGDREQAVAWARRALSYEPESESALRRLMETLDRAGDRAGAIRAYEGFTRRLAQDLDQQPS